jgi:O-antigen/teichoic acid export membrane protein
LAQNNRPKRRGTKLFLGAATASQIFALVRYVLLARLLGPEQLGVAAILILTQAFFNLVTDLAADRFIVQDENGDHFSVQEFVQLVLVGRGVLIAVSMAVLAWPLALLYKAPQLTIPLAILGLFPLIGSFVHLDMRRAQRASDFRVEAISKVASEFAGLIAVVIAAFITRNAIAVVYGLIANALVQVICSHLMSERKYRLRYYREYASKLARFSFPLMITGTILFFASQGDRILVARNIGFAGLGHYSAILLLIYYPAGVLQNFVETMYLPLVAGSRGDPESRSKTSDVLGGQALLSALFMSAGFAIVAPFAIPILYGKSFVEPRSIVALIGVLQTARFLVLWPTTLALGMGKSKVILANTIIRLIAWPAAIVGVLAGFGLFGIVLGYVVGELTAISIALFMLSRQEANLVVHGPSRLVTFAAASTCIVSWAFLPSNFSLGQLVLLLAISVLLVIWVVRFEKDVLKDALHKVNAFVPQ